MAADAVPGPAHFFQFPTIFWLASNDTALLAVCALGMIFSALLFLNIVPTVCLALNWALYLSIVTAGGDFMSFQWDVLLLEAGFLAIFLKRAPSVIWLYWWLVFRLMFFSGFSKLASGDPTWRNLDSLKFHYLTQPLPPWTAWYAHRLPEWFQEISCAAMFGVELGAPFLIFLGSRARRLACALFIGLQAMIIVTGNYGIFNWLSIVLCFTLLIEPVKPTRRVWPFFAVILVLTVLRFPLDWRSAPDVVRQVRRAVVSATAPFHVVNSYGLFAVMTAERPEIIVEGSLDGKEWKAYEFVFKPGDPAKKPAFVAPYHPRLDWQMWFAALSTPQDNIWFLKFSERLLKGSPAVLKLLKEDPFAGQRPRMLRAWLYDYRFSQADLKAKGIWWVREGKKGYLPSVNLS